LSAAASGPQSAVNNLAASLVLPGMRIHRQRGQPGPPADRQDDTMGTPAQRHRWRPRRRRDRGNARRAAGTGPAWDEIAPAKTGPGKTAPGDTVATAMQLAIGLLTASLDSPELEAWALAALTPHDADGLGNFMAGMHLVSELLLRELHEATGQPPEATLQRLAILAEHRRGTPSAG
jgi:hypothetical protein